jgi:hypothetical protein
VATADAAREARADTRRIRPQERSMSTTPHRLRDVERTERAATAIEDIAFIAILVSAIALAVAMIVAMLVM